MATGQEVLDLYDWCVMNREIEGVENCEDLNKSQNTSSNDNNVESIRTQPTYAEIARRAVK